MSKQCSGENNNFPYVFKFNDTKALPYADDSLDESRADLHKSRLSIGNMNSSLLNNQSRTELEERKIFEIINDKKDLDFTRVLALMTKLNSTKYDDESLKNEDENIENNILSAIEKLSTNRDYDYKVSQKMFEFEKYLNYRIVKEIKPYSEGIDWIEKIFSRKRNFFENINEIQNLYTMFFLHPCIFRDYFECDDDINNFLLTKELLKGFKPLFKEMNTYSKRCLSIENVVYLNLFNMLLDIYFGKIAKIKKQKNITIENIFENDNSFLTDFMEIYFYDEFRKSILYDIFEKGLKDLNFHAKNNKQATSLKAEGNKSEESFKIGTLMNIFDFSNKAQDDKNLKVKILFFYCINKIK